MRELKATDKITQKMTRDGAVSENLATGEVEHISSREPETELSASSEESAGADVYKRQLLCRSHCDEHMEYRHGYLRCRAKRCEQQRRRHHREYLH